MPFAEWLVVHQLRLQGWPRKRGLLRVLVVDSAALLNAVTNAIQVMMGIGARQPELAMRLATELSVDQTKAGVDHTIMTLRQQAERKITQFGSQMPWRSLMALTPPGATVEVPMPRKEPRQESLEWKYLGKEPFAAAIGLWPAEGLAWGLSHPKQVDEAFNAASILAGYFRYTVPSLVEFDELCTELVTSYEQQVAPLPLCPA